MSEAIVRTTELQSRVCRMASRSAAPQAILMDDMTHSAEKLSSLCTVLKALHEVLVIGNTRAQVFDLIYVFIVFEIKP